MVMVQAAGQSTVHNLEPLYSHRYLHLPGTYGGVPHLAAFLPKDASQGLPDASVLRGCRPVYRLQLNLHSNLDHIEWLHYEARYCPR